MLRSPYLRVSVDYDTVFDVAGKGVEEEVALLVSIDYATRMAINRKKKV